MHNREFDPNRPLADVPVLDLDVTHTVKVVGMFQLWFTWYRDAEQGHAFLPGLAITRRDYPPSAQVPYLLRLKDVWVFDEEIGDGRQALMVIRSALRTLGFEHDAHNLMRLLGLIRDHLQDLHEMPPSPRLAGFREVGFAQVRREGEIVSEKAIGYDV